ncbi:hypothetical protein H6504_01760 [Candidatus Woesearchaeota archaeon]|nr:hypothetical protein [Candidatus Woesearchaeota archaeon]
MCSCPWTPFQLIVPAHEIILQRFLEALPALCTIALILFGFYRTFWKKSFLMGPTMVFLGVLAFLYVGAPVTCNCGPFPLTEPELENVTFLQVRKGADFILSAPVSCIECDIRVEIADSRIVAKDDFFAYLYRCEQRYHLHLYEKKPPQNREPEYTIVCSPEVQKDQRHNN